MGQYMAQDAEYEALLAKARAAYLNMTPEQRRTHDEDQKVSFVCGNLQLDGITVAEDQVRRMVRKLARPMTDDELSAAAMKAYVESIPEPTDEEVAEMMRTVDDLRDEGLEPTMAELAEEEEELEGLFEGDD